MFGTNSSAMRERLLREENLTLDKCLQICRASELLGDNSKTPQGQTVEEVNELKQTTVSFVVNTRETRTNVQLLAKITYKD